MATIPPDPTRACLPGSVTPSSASADHAESQFSWPLIRIHPARSPLWQSQPHSVPVQACLLQQSRERCWGPANSLLTDVRPPRVGRGQALGQIRQRWHILLPAFPSVRCYVSCETMAVQWSMCKEMSLLRKTQFNFNFLE